jgi:DNA-binding SARP family transcriptional activator/Tfp pilus assembly protein PilF
MAIDLRLLGPVEAWVDGELVDLGWPKQRLVLAVLAADANAVVHMDQLLGRVWDSHLPANRAVLYTYVGNLRRALSRAVGLSLVRRSGGYVLEADEDAIDVIRFGRLIYAARATAADAEAADLLSQAMREWRGRALGGLVGEWVDAARTRWENDRIAAAVELADLRLRQGDVGATAGNLIEILESHPLDERLASALLRALHLSGRHAEAIDVYQRLRRRLADELGVDPSPALTRLYARILRHEGPADTPTVAGAGVAVLAAPGGTGTSRDLAMPAELPRRPALFTGRVRELDLLREMRRRSGTIVIRGMAGAGKTALALEFAHALASEFPDGQLHISLRGYDAGRPPKDPAEALSHVLRAFGADPRGIPDDLDERAARYRSLLGDRRILLVLDDAASAEQVRPLLPGSQHCLVLVTSRDRLVGLAALDGAESLDLDVFSTADAMALLERILTTDLVAAEPKAATELIDLCGRLPLALRLAAANVADRSPRRIADAVARLGRGDRLAVLAVAGDEGITVARGLDLSYGALAGQARQLFRGLGLIPGTDFTVDVAAALGATTPDHAETILASLVDRHLLEPYRPGRYRLHDLVRVYALSRVRREDSQASRAECTVRMLRWYASQAEAAAAVLEPTVVRLPSTPVEADLSERFVGPHEAAAWLEAEQSNLVAAVQCALQGGHDDLAWSLADALRGFFMRRRHIEDWLATAKAGLGGAQRAGNHQAEAAMHNGLANAYRALGRYGQAAEHYGHALRLHDSLHWPEAHAAALGGYGLVCHDTGYLRRAVRLHGRALAINRRLGNRQREAIDLNNLGLSYLVQGHLDRAAEYLRRSLILSRDSGATTGEVASLNNLATTHRLLGNYPQARAEAEAALGLSREIGSRSSETDALSTLAAVHTESGAGQRALDVGACSLALAAQIRDLRLETQVRNTLGHAHLLASSVSAAAEQFHVAYRTALAIHCRHSEAQALGGLAATSLTLRQAARAYGYAHRSLVIAKRCGFQVVQVSALTYLATAVLDECPQRTTRYASHAVNLARTTGYRLGEALALSALFRAKQASGEADGADEIGHRSSTIMAEIGGTGARIEIGPPP